MFVLNTVFDANIGLLLAVLIFWIAVAVLMALCLRFTRACAPEDRLHAGRVFPWIGWSLLAALFIVPWFIVSTFIFPDVELLWESPYWWLDALAVSALSAFGIAFFAYGSGYALGLSAPPFSTFWQSVKPMLVPGGLAYFLISLPTAALSNYTHWFLTDETVGGATRWLTYAATSLADAIAIALGIALSVIVFLKANREPTL